MHYHERTDQAFKVGKRFNDLNILNKLCQLSLIDIPLEEFLRSVLDILLTEIFSGTGSYGVIFILDGKKNDLKRVTHSIGLEHPCERVRFGERLCGITASEKNILIARDCQGRYNCCKEESDHFHICIPVLHSEETIGIINLLVKDNFYVYQFEKESVKSFAQFISNLIAIKILNSKMRELSQVVEQTADHIIITDKEGNIEYVNKAFTELTGYTEEDCIGKTPRILKSGKHETELYSMLWEKILKGTVHKGITVNKKKNGELYYEEKTITPLKNDNGDITHFISTGKDVSEMMEFQEKLKQSEQRLKNLSEATFEGVVISIDGIVVDLNDRSAEMMRSTRNGFLGKSLLDFVVPEDRNRLIRVIEDKMNNIDEYNVVRADGTIFPAEVKGRIFVDNNNYHVRVSTIRDLTEQKKTENILKAAKERAEKSDRLKSEFLAQMSHEIRTPINSMLNFTSLIETELYDKVSDDLKEAFLYIKNGGRRLIRTVDMILNMSQIQNGIYDTKIERNDLLRDIIEPVLNELSQAAKERNLEMILENNMENTSVYVDNYSMYHLFHNLIDNAVKYTNEGQIKVILHQNNKGERSVDIADTGIGISKEYLSNIFEPFSQEETGYTRSYEGNGLGLALVKKYAEINKAGIGVWSEKGKGSVFTLQFGK